MIEARDGQADVAEEVAALVPRRSATRTAVLALVTVAVLAAAWFSPAVLRPTLSASGSGAGASVGLDGGDEMLTVIQLSPRAWPSATLDGVIDVPGARVADVWLIASDGSLLETHTGGEEDALTLLRAAYPDAAVAPGGNLPRAFRSGEALHLAILWQIDDCALLDPDTLPVGQVRGPLGDSHLDPIWEAAGPAFFIDPEAPTSERCGDWF